MQQDTVGRSCVTVPRVTSGVQSTIDYLPAVNGYGKLSSEFRIHRPLAGQREDRADMHFGHSAYNGNKVIIGLCGTLGHGVAVLDS